MPTSSIITKGGAHLTLNIEGRMTPLMVSATDKKFAEIVQAIKDNKSDDEIYAIVKAEEIRLKKAVEVTPQITVKGGEVYFEGEKVENYTVTKMLSMIGEGFNVKPMALFLANLMENPSNRINEHLYAFLEKGNIPLTEDGCFLAYRNVADDYYDIHSHTVLNKPANLMTKADKDLIGSKMFGARNEAKIEIIDGVTTISMQRRNVDDDPNRTCSNGFHVASFDYLQHFGNGSGRTRTLICKIHPKDVVAIPSDYNDTKMRVCRYQIIDELDRMEDKLKNTTVADTVTDSAFSIIGVFADDSEETYESADSLGDLLPTFEDFDESSNPYVEIRLVNNKTGVLIDSKEVTPEDGDEFGDSDEEGSFSVYQNGRLIDSADSEQDAALAALAHDRSNGVITITDKDGFVVATFE